MDLTLREDLSRNGGKVWVGMEAEVVKEPDGRKVAKFATSDPIAGTWITAYLCSDDAPDTPEERQLVTVDPERQTRLCQQDKVYCYASEYLEGELVRNMTTVAIPAETSSNVSRMGGKLEMESCVKDIPLVVIAEIYRCGGDPSTTLRRYLHRNLKLVDIQTVSFWSQRLPPVPGEEPATEQYMKGWAQLEGRMIIVAEHALASRKSVKDAMALLRQKCPGEPSGYTFGFINATAENISDLQEDFPGCNVVALILHGGLTPKFYLEDPGGKDFGKKRNNCPDLPNGCLTV